MLASDGLVVRAQTAQSTIQRVATVIGPPLGGFVLLWDSLPLALGVDGVLFALATFLLVATKAPQRSHAVCDESQKSDERNSVFRGVVLVTRSAVLRSVIALIALTELVSSGILNAGFTLYAANHGLGAPWLGFALSLFGVGAAASSLGVFFRTPRRCGAMVCLTLLLSGLVFAIFGMSPSSMSQFLLLFLAGAAGGVCSTLLTTVFLVSSSDTSVSQVMAVLNLACFGVVPVGTFLTGVISDAFGIDATFIILGFIEVAIAVISLALPSIRRLSIDS